MTLQFGLIGHCLADRLYSSIDELLLGIPSSLNSERTAQSNLDADSLQGAKFFLTSSNRAPELNLYGKPRVSIWPIDSTYTDKASQRVSVTGRLLSFVPPPGESPFSSRGETTRVRSTTSSSQTIVDCSIIWIPSAGWAYLVTAEVLRINTVRGEAGRF